MNGGAEKFVKLETIHIAAMSSPVLKLRTNVQSLNVFVVRSCFCVCSQERNIFQQDLLGKTSKFKAAGFG